MTTPCPYPDVCHERQACQRACDVPDTSIATSASEAELAYIAALPKGVIYIPTVDGGHNTREANEAYRRASDATNARWRALIAVA